MLVLAEVKSLAVVVVHVFLALVVGLLEYLLVVGIDGVPAPFAHLVVLDGRELVL